MPHILTVSGSLRAASSNTAVLEALKLLAPPAVTVQRYLELDALPAFNPDLESGDLPAPVARLRALIGQPMRLSSRRPNMRAAWRVRSRICSTGWSVRWNFRVSRLA
jgi:hypothetical protein